MSVSVCVLGGEQAPSLPRPHPPPSHSSDPQGPCSREAGECRKLLAACAQLGEVTHIDCPPGLPFGSLQAPAMLGLFHLLFPALGTVAKLLPSQTNTFSLPPPFRVAPGGPRWPTPHPPSKCLSHTHRPFGCCLCEVSVLCPLPTVLFVIFGVLLGRQTSPTPTICLSSGWQVAPSKLSHVRHVNSLYCSKMYPLLEREQ